MDAYISTFKSFAGATKSSPKGPEDYIDKLNYQITPNLLLIMATIIGMKQYVFQAIQCWTKQEHTQAREEYIENYCWVQSTFYYKDDEPMSFDHDPGEGKRLHYYQWIPFILMGQAILFYIPHLIWLFMSSNTGVNLRDMMICAHTIPNDNSEGKRTGQIHLAASLLQKFVRFRSSMRNQKFCARCANFIFGKPTFAMYLIVVYAFVKLIYIANCVGQMYMMRSYLGLNMTNFGLKILGDISNNRTWETTHVFPRVTYCKLHVREIGANVPHVLQCVLPVNMLNEKFYILIWFWVMMLLCSNIMSLLRWLSRNVVAPNRGNVVKKLLKVATSMDSSFERDRFLEKEFIRGFLETDGIFVLSMISSNSGDIIASDIVKELWFQWKSTRKVDSKYCPDDEKIHLAGYDKKGVMV